MCVRVCVHVCVRACECVSVNTYVSYIQLRNEVAPHNDTLNYGNPLNQNIETRTPSNQGTPNI